MRILANYKKSIFRIIGGEIIVVNNLFIFEPMIQISTKSIIKFELEQIDKISQKCNSSLTIFTKNKEIYDFIAFEKSDIKQLILFFKNTKVKIETSEVECKQNIMVRHPVVSWFIISFIFSIIFRFLL